MALSATQWVICGAMVLVALLAAICDARTGKIPNVLTLPALVLGIALNGIMSGPMGLLRSALGVVVCGAVPLLLFRMRALGGGDVKLFAALGSLAGVALGIEAQLYGFLAAGVFALFWLTWNGKLWRTFANSFFLATNVLLPESRRRAIEPELMSSLRLGVSIFAGTTLAVGMRVVDAWL